MIPVLLTIGHALVWIGFGVYVVFAGFTAIIFGSVARENGCPLFILPFVAVGYLLLWPIAWIDEFMDSDNWKA